MSGFAIDPFLRRPHQPPPKRGNMPEFERGIAPAEAHAGVAAVRVIPVTAAMREADARRGAATSAVAMAWRERVFGPGKAPAPVAEKPKASIYQPIAQERRNRGAKDCSGRCGRTTHNPSGLCHKCLKYKAQEEAAG